MKYFQVLFFVAVALIYVKAEVMDIPKISKECQTETGASDDEVKSALKEQASGSPEGKCLRACMMKRIGMMDDNGHLNKENSYKVVKILSKGDEEKEKVGGEIVEACADIELPEDHCEAAETLNTCIRKNSEGKNAPSIED